MAYEDRILGKSPGIAGLELLDYTQPDPAFVDTRDLRSISDAYQYCLYQQGGDTEGG